MASLSPISSLQPHDLADRVVLDAQQLGRRHLAFFGRLARRNQGIGPDQAADMIGAERRL